MSDIENAKQMLEMLYAIKNTSGSNAKKEVMKKYLSEDWYCIVVLSYLLDGLKPTGISKKSWTNVEAGDNEESSLMGYVNWLSKGNHSSHDDIAFAKSQEKYWGELAYILTTRDISLGVSSSTYNKVAKELGIKRIPVMSPMLSKNINTLTDKRLNNFLKNGVHVTTKLDGIRALAIHDDHQWHFFSRQGKEITGLEHLTLALSSLLNVRESRVYDGELIVPSDMSAEDGFRVTAGVVNSKGDKSNVVFNIFDAPLKNDFFGETPLPERETYRERMIMLDQIRHNNTFIQPIDHLGLVDNMEDLNKLFTESIANGQEGLMLNADSPYVPKRTDQLLKMKQENSVDLRVIDIEEGTGRLQGTTGALVVMYKGNELRIGTGLSDLDRKEFWSDIHGIVGKIIEIGYTTESQDKNGNHSLRFPRFLQIRDDKDEESYD